LEKSAGEARFAATAAHQGIGDDGASALTSELV